MGDGDNHPINKPIMPVYVLFEDPPYAIMTACDKSNGGPLTQAEIDDLVAYILSLGESGAVVQSSPTVIPPQTNPDSALRGWVGVLLAVLLFAAIIIIAYLLQRRQPNPD